MPDDQLTLDDQLKGGIAKIGSADLVVGIPKTSQCGDDRLRRIDGGEGSARAVDSDLRSINPGWVGKLLGPIVRGEADYVAPLYLRDKHDGTITNTIAYPLARALYGLRVRQPIGGEFGFSASLARAFLEEADWSSDVARFGIDIFMTTTALAAWRAWCRRRSGPRSTIPRTQARTSGRCSSRSSARFSVSRRAMDGDGAARVRLEGGGRRRRRRARGTGARCRSTPRRSRRSSARAPEESAIPGHARYRRPRWRSFVRRSPTTMRSPVCAARPGRESSGITVKATVHTPNQSQAFARALLPLYYGRVSRRSRARSRASTPRGREKAIEDGALAFEARQAPHDRLGLQGARARAGDGGRRRLPLRARARSGSVSTTTRSSSPGSRCASTAPAPLLLSANTERTTSPPSSWCTLRPRRSPRRPIPAHSISIRRTRFLADGLREHVGVLNANPRPRARSVSSSVRGDLPRHVRGARLSRDRPSHRPSASKCAARGDGVDLRAPGPRRRAALDRGLDAAPARRDRRCPVPRSRGSCRRKGVLTLEVSVIPREDGMSASTVNADLRRGARGAAAGRDPRLLRGLHAVPGRSSRVGFDPVLIEAERLRPSCAASTSSRPRPVSDRGHPVVRGAVRARRPDHRVPAASVGFAGARGRDAAPARRAIRGPVSRRADRGGAGEDLPRAAPRRARAARRGPRAARTTAPWMQHRSSRFVVRGSGQVDGRPLRFGVSSSPAAERALTWCETFGDPDRDGYVVGAQGEVGQLRNKGWKDSANSLTGLDGAPASLPAALVKVQGIRLRGTDGTRQPVCPRRRRGPCRPAARSGARAARAVSSGTSGSEEAQLLRAGARRPQEGSARRHQQRGARAVVRFRVRPIARAPFASRLLKQGHVHGLGDPHPLGHVSHVSTR